MSLVAVACFLPGRVKDLSAPRCNGKWKEFVLKTVWGAQLKSALNWRDALYCCQGFGRTVGYGVRVTGCQKAFVSRFGLCVVHAIGLLLDYKLTLNFGRLRLKYDGIHTETRFLLSAKRTSPFKSAGSSVQSTTGSRGVLISGSNAGTPCFEVVWRVLATHSIRQFPLLFPSRASPCAITFQLDPPSIDMAEVLLFSFVASVPFIFL